VTGYKTHPTARQDQLLAQLHAAAGEAQAAHRRLEALVRQGHRAGLRPVWLAEATGLARSTIYLMLRRGNG
jgi:ATP/maltotriose-dependent transcriptional regulator MalT